MLLLSLLLLFARGFGCARAFVTVTRGVERVACTRMPRYDGTRCYMRARYD